MPVVAGRFTEVSGEEKARAGRKDDAAIASASLAAAVARVNSANAMAEKFGGISGMQRIGVGDGGSTMGGSSSAVEKNTAQTNKLLLDISQKLGSGTAREATFK
jgi:hypothetical protein